MRTEDFGVTGVRLPVIGQGTWQMEEDDRASALTALCVGLDLGLTHIDTAEMYGSGVVEQMVGEAIAGRRDEVFLVSKVLPGNASAAGTRTACERSLRALRTDHLDCYLLHWRGQHPLAETITALEALKAAGKIRSWGVSNFDVEDLEETLTLIGAEAIACNQVLYHLKERRIEHTVLPWCQAHHVSVVAYSPFGQRAFPGAGTSGRQVLDSLATARGATARQMALAFLTRDPIVLAIPKAAHALHVRDNAAAGKLALTAEEIARIDAAFPRGSRARHLPMA